jgi:hypothetical protein
MCDPGGTSRYKICYETLCISAYLNRDKLLVISLSNKKSILFLRYSFNCDPGGTRTHGPMIKSQLLYQLSYGVD